MGLPLCTASGPDSPWLKVWRSGRTWCTEALYKTQDLSHTNTINAPHPVQRPLPDSVSSWLGLCWLAGALLRFGFQEVGFGVPAGLQSKPFELLAGDTSWFLNLAQSHCHTCQKLKTATPAGSQCIWQLIHWLDFFPTAVWCSFLRIASHIFIPARGGPLNNSRSGKAICDHLKRLYKINILLNKSV